MIRGSQPLGFLPRKVRGSGHIALQQAIRDTGGSSYIVRLPDRGMKLARLQLSCARGIPKSVYVALGFEASRDKVLSDGLSRYRLLHFATHGVVDARQAGNVRADLVIGR